MEISTLGLIITWYHTCVSCVFCVPSCNIQDATGQHQQSLVIRGQRSLLLVRFYESSVSEKNLEFRASLATRRYSRCCGPADAPQLTVVASCDQIRPKTATFLHQSGRFHSLDPGIISYFICINSETKVAKGYRYLKKRHVVNVPQDVQRSYRRLIISQQIKIHTWLSGSFPAF